MPCSGYNPAFMWAFPLGLAALSPFVVLIVWKARRSRKVQRMVASFLRLRNRLSLRAKIKVLWSFFQITSKLDRVYQVPMPSTVVAFFKSLPFIDIDVDMIGPLECYGVSGFENELFFALFMPVVLISVLLAFFMTWHIGRVCVLKVRKARSDARLDRMRQKITSRFQRSGAVKRLKRQQRLLATAALAAKPEKKEGSENPGTMLGAIAAGWFSALPHLLIVLYCVSPTAYNKAFSMYQCVTYEEMPETNLWYKELSDGEKEELGYRKASYLIADVEARCMQDATGSLPQPEDERIRLLGQVVLGLFCGAVPLLYMVLLMLARKPITDSMFEATNLSTALSFLYQDFKPVFFWWEFVDLIKKVALVGFFVTIKPGTLIQLILATCVCLVIFCAEAMSQPYAKTSDNAVAMSCSFCLCFFFVCTIIIKVTTITDLIGGLSPISKAVLFVHGDFITFLMIGTLVLALIICSIVLVMTMTQSAREAVRALIAAQKEEEARGRMTLPPVCDWQLAKGHKYCTFLSHYKVEAGSDARYLSDLIRRMTGAPAYLDSTDLVDLRLLFQDGVHKTDAFVILATKGVLTRPWCLMEMWEAARHQIPIVLFPVVGGGFDLADTKHLLSNLEVEMEMRNQYCMPEVMAHLRKQGVTDVRELEDVLLAHIGVSDDLKRPGRPVPPGRSKQSAATKEDSATRRLLGSAERRAQLRDSFKKGGASALGALKRQGSSLKRQGSSLRRQGSSLRRQGSGLGAALRRQGTSSSSRLSALVAKVSGPSSPKPGPSSPSAPAAGAEDRSSLVTINVAQPPPAPADRTSLVRVKLPAPAAGTEDRSSLVRVKFSGEPGSSSASPRPPSPPPSPPEGKLEGKAKRKGFVHSALTLTLTQTLTLTPNPNPNPNPNLTLGRLMGRAHAAEERLAHKMHDGAVGLAHGMGNAAHRAHEAAAHAAHEVTLT